MQSNLDHQTSPREHLRLFIDSWLAGVPSSGKHTHTVTRKRRASHSPSRLSPLSPPATLPDRRMAATGPRTPSPSKKRRLVQRDISAPDDDDLDATPRGAGVVFAVVPPIRYPPSSNSNSQTESSSRTSSKKSRQPSPTKQMVGLGIRSDGIVTRYIDPDNTKDLPPGLAEVVNALEAINNAVGIIPRSHMEAIKADSLLAPDFMFAPPDHLESLVRPPPSLEAIKALHSWALHCEKKDAPEASWNDHVHSTVLQLAVHGSMYHNKQLLDVANLTSSSPITSYLPPLSRPRKIDFALVFDPDQAGDSHASSKINSLRAHLPEYSINHCSQTQVLATPIAMSIETKRDDAAGAMGSGAGADAMLQVGTWEAGRWNLLGGLVRRGVEMGAVEETMTGEGEMGEKDKTSDVVASRLAKLPFLPAVVVQGHEWVFAATTREGEKTILWLKTPFGSTRRTTDIYKVFAGLRVLTGYVEDVLWPWYRAEILGIARPGG